MYHACIWLHPKTVNPFKLPMRTDNISFNQVSKTQSLLEVQFISNYFIANFFKAKIMSSLEQMILLGVERVFDPVLDRGH